MWKNTLKPIAIALLFCFFSNEVNSEKLTEDDSTNAISYGKDNILDSHVFYQPFRRRADPISNDLYHIVSLDIRAFHLNVASISTVDSEEIKEKVTSTFKEMKFNPALREVILDDIIITTGTQTTQIDFPGGDATFIVETLPFQTHSSVFNAALLDHLAKELNSPGGIFDGVSVQVGSGSSYSRSFTQPSEDSEDVEDVNDVDYYYSEKLESPARPESQESVGGSVDTETPANAMSAGVLVGSLVAVFAVGIAAAIYIKKRRNFRSRITSSSPRFMKRDLDFEQFVVECCTDNDMFDNDEHHFTYNKGNNELA